MTEADEIKLNVAAIIKSQDDKQKALEIEATKPAKKKKDKKLRRAPTPIFGAENEDEIQKKKEDIIKKLLLVQAELEGEGEGEDEVRI